MTYTDIIKKAEETHLLSKDEIVTLLQPEYDGADLFAAADRTRKKFVGDDVQLRGLIEFSNYCRNNCLYCGIRRDNHAVQRYRIAPDAIIRLAQNAAEAGYKTVVLQSGEDVYYTVGRLQYIISEIKKSDIAVTLSIGEKSFEEYAAYKAAGADRYLLRIETTNKDLYHRLDPGMSWENRKRCLDDLRASGYEVGSGSMVGLPEQSLSSIADDILFFNKINVDMAGIGPFIPHPDTPLKNAKGRAFTLSLKTMAITRLLLPDINIPATTAMEALRPNGRLIALQSGANVIMPNVTDLNYCKLYELYPGKPTPSLSLAEQRHELEKLLLAIGRRIGTGYGGHFSFGFNNKP